ncbi:MAG TPA: monovalent cation/H+ antiporter subunit D family protein [Dehalococcoidia bacterium]|nr:monovalent cation/H+ antiporter subunit D family protein [Dehalococcoidia bacterium]
MSSLSILTLAPLLLFAFITTLVGIWRLKWAYAAAVIGMLLSLIAAGAGVFRVLAEGKLRHFLGGWPPPFGIEYVLDHLSAFMALIIVFIGLIAVVYPPEAGLYQPPRKGIPMYGLLLLLFAGLVGVVVTGDLFNLFVFLEIYSLASYALITLGGDRAVVASFRYLILGTIAGSFYLLGVGFIYFSTGTLNMADAAQRLVPLYSSPVVMAAVALIVIGMCIKMALFPLHVWLPDAHSYASPMVAAVLAGIQIEVAAYVVVRFMLTIFQPHYFIDVLPVTTVIGWMAAVGIIFGSVMAIAQRDFKRMLAYSTVAQVGYIGLGIGLANPLGLIGGLLHILNHAFMKSCLFLVAGGIRYKTGLHEIPKFAGLGRKMPLMMAAFTVAALSMVGIPPTAGFFSKWYLVLGSIDAGNWVFLAVILASSLLTAVYFFRMVEKLYAVPSSGDAAVEQATEPSAGILVPILVLAVGIIILGLINALIVTQLLMPVAALLPS